MLDRFLSPKSEPDALSSELNNAALDKLRELDPTGGGTFVARVLKTYLATQQSQLAELEQAFEHRDAETAIRVVHSFKSSSAYVGAEAFSATCAHTEQLMRAHELAGDARRLFTDLAVQRAVSGLICQAQRVRQAMEAEVRRGAQP